MNRQWMPLFVEDFLADTVDLETDEVGVYLFMILIAWKRGDGSVPGDRKILKRVLQRHFTDFHGHTFNRIVPKLLARYFIHRADGNYYQKRVEYELQIARKLSATASQKAGKRWAAIREIKQLADAAAMPIQNSTEHKIVRMNKFGGRGIVD